MRLEFYRNSAEHHPRTSVVRRRYRRFVNGYASTVAGTQMDDTVNPHNEYLLIAIQLGVVGLASLLGLFSLQWRWPRDSSRYTATLHADWCSTS